MDESVQDGGILFQDQAEAPDPLEENDPETGGWPPSDEGPAGAPERPGDSAAVQGERPAGVRYEDFLEFTEIFPEAARDPRSIPPEVWAEVRQGRSLVGAYTSYDRVQARRTAEILRYRAAAQQNAAGAAGSTGSMRSAESGLGGKDAFLQGFLE